VLFVLKLDFTLMLSIFCFCRAPISLGFVFKGIVSGEHGIGLTKAPYLGMEVSPAAMALQRRIKAAFDPQNIMNPGKIFPDPPPPAAGEESLNF